MLLIELLASMRAQSVDSNVELMFDRAKSAFGNGTVFIERFLDKPKHIEVQILGDNHGNVVHLYERDCSVQRRHQKVVEIAPAKDLPQETRQAILDDAVRLAKSVNYSELYVLRPLSSTDRYRKRWYR